MKKYKTIKSALAQAEFLHLDEKEKKALTLLQSLSSTPHHSQALETILTTNCQSIESLIKLAIYCPQVKKWCQDSKQMSSTWITSLAELGKQPEFNYQFKEQKHLSSFYLLAGLVLYSEHLTIENDAAKTLSLFVAMESFYSFHAAYILVNKGLKILYHHEDQSLLNKLTKQLEVISSVHGSPGYLLYALFTFQLSQFYNEKDSTDDRIPSLMHCCFRFLLTAHLLEKTCANELANADFGHHDLFKQFINKQQLPSTKPITKLSELIGVFNESKFVKPIAKTAMREAKQLAQQYHSSNLHCFSLH